LDAQAGGITRATFDTAFADVTPDPRVMELTRKQPEYSKPAGEYLDLLVAKSRVEIGARKALEWAKIAAAIEKRFGVDPRIIIAIWGIETNYGSAEIPWDVIRSIATLAHGGYRTPYFRKELLVALRILQDRHITRDKLLGSWAGAMGQPQFMPSSFINYAVDFSGDGRKDIWTNVPDVLASIANYVKKFGWKSDLPWGFEINVPREFDYSRSRASFAEWTALRVVRADGGSFPSNGDAILFFPSGVSGPAFLVTANFLVIKRYNNSDLYALAVAHLSDRINGHAPIRASWPTDERPLSRDQRIALQKRLAELGYAVRDFEGRFDFDLRDFIRQVQTKFGMVPDGHPTAALLERLEVR
jgi:lytic murein transglycosylase